MKHSLVIGAAGGIGMAVAAACVARGDKVLATVLDAAQADRLAAEVPGIDRIEILKLDDAEAVVGAVKTLVAGMERLDQVAVCAAIGPIGPVEMTSIAICRRTLEINTLSNIAIFQAVVDALRATRGRLLFISSMSGKLAMPFIGIYTASKHALEGIADVMRQEVASDGVNVVMVEPGGVRTGMVKDQIALTHRMIAELTPEQNARYGALFRGFAAAAQAGYDGAAGGSTPEQVAEVVMSALNADRPETRYIAGDDAKQLLGARATMSDREMDAMIGGFLGG